MAEEIKDTELKTEDVKVEVVEKEETALEYLENGLSDLFKDKDSTSVTEDTEDEKSEDVVESVATDKPKEEFEEVPIPQEQVDIARQLGFSDEEIVKLAEQSPDRLERMVTMSKTPKRGAEEEKVVKVEETKPTKVDHVKTEDFGDLDPDLVKVFSAKMNGLIDVINTQNDKLSNLGEHSSEVDRRHQLDETRKIDTVFDTASEHVPEFGKADSLTQSQVQARKETFGIVQILKATRGIDETAALNEAIYLYGLSKVNLDELEVKAEEKVKEKINKNKKTMSPRPGGKKEVGEAKVGRKAAMEHLEEGLKEIFGN